MTGIVLEATPQPGAEYRDDVGERAVDETLLESHRVELTGYCYRMLGSSFDAEDAVQETLIRAWRGRDRFEWRSSIRTWLYRIATNVCLTMLDAGQRRARPIDLSEASVAPADPGAPLPAERWIEPIPDVRVLTMDADPADRAAGRESIRLAFVAALQHLAPRQRAVLILREVLSWSADETAKLLETSTPAVNSALQRARARLAEQGQDELVRGQHIGPLDDHQQALLTRYVDAFERFDLDQLISLVDLDVTLSLAPYARWMRGPVDLRRWYSGPGSGCRGSMLCWVAANGAPAFGQYRPGGVPWALHVLGTRQGRITSIDTFLDTERLFPLFGLPAQAPSRPRFRM
jgi:RNA polymerase sigma-70 factor (ECF subfamily)